MFIFIPSLVVYAESLRSYLQNKGELFYFSKVVLTIPLYLFLSTTIISILVGYLRLSTSTLLGSSQFMCGV